MNPVRVALISIGAIVPLLLLLVAGTAYSSANDWAAVVDGHEVGEREFLSELAEFGANEGLAQFFPGLGDSQPGSVPAELSAVWLGRLIQQELVDRVFEQRGLTVTDATRTQAEQISLQQFQGPAVWEAFSPAFRARMVERDARFLVVVDSFGGEVSEDELRSAYAAAQESFLEACSSHILVETLPEAEAVSADLAAGGDFAALAAEKSIDPGSGAQGGDLGCQRRGSFVEPFDSEVFTLPIGTVSAPVQTQFGYHIIRVQSRDVLSFEEVRPELEQQLAGRGQEEFGQALFDLVSTARIEVNPKYCSSFEVGPQGPSCVPPVAPAPPDGVPVGSAEAEVPLDLFQPQPVP